MLEWILDASHYVPRAYCGDWPVWMSRAWMASNTAIALAYFCIPIGLYCLWRKRRKSLPKARILLAFSAFISFCGIGHLVSEVIVFWWPAYRLFLLIHVITAMVSIATATIMPSVIRYFMNLPTLEEYRHALDDKDMALAGMDAAIRDKMSLLEAEQRRNLAIKEAADEMRSKFEELQYKIVTHDKYQELRESLHRLRGV